MTEAAVVQTELPLVAPATPKRFELPAETVAPETPEPAANTTESAPVAEPEAKPEPEVTSEQAAKRKERRDQNKLEKAFRQRAEAQAKADILEKRLAELEKAQAPKAPEGEPRLEQFDFDAEKYATAKAEYATKKAATEREATQRAEAQKKYQDTLVSNWEEKVERGVDKYDDWQQKVGELKPTAPFIAALMEADNGEDIAHYLGSHLKEAQRIAQLPPRTQIREIGKLEAKLLSEPVKPKTPSKAPAPITPLTGAATITTNQPSEDDDYPTWFKKRTKQVHGSR